MWLWNRHMRNERRYKGTRAKLAATKRRAALCGTKERARTSSTYKTNPMKYQFGEETTCHAQASTTVQHSLNAHRTKVGEPCLKACRESIEDTTPRKL